MPTGYTADIKDGITFEQYAMNCAKAFGACVTMRDDPQDTPIPDEFEPSSYHKDAIEKAENDLENLKRITKINATKLALLEYDSEVSRIETAMKKNRDLEIKYKAMLLQVNAWQPPTQDHFKFKEFMASQISQSIDWDCGNDYYVRSLEKIEMLTGQEWITKARVRLLKDIDYHSKNWEEEKERVAGRNSWVKKLRESLIHR